MSDRSERRWRAVLASRSRQPITTESLIAGYICGSVVEADSLTIEQTTEIIAKNLQNVPEAHIEALTHSAKKLVMTDLK